MEFIIAGLYFSGFVSHCSFFKIGLNGVKIFIAAALWPLTGPLLAITNDICDHVIEELGKP